MDACLSCFCDSLGSWRKTRFFPDCNVLIFATQRPSHRTSRCVPVFAKASSCCKRYLFCETEYRWSNSTGAKSSQVKFGMFRFESRPCCKAGAATCCVPQATATPSWHLPTNLQKPRNGILLAVAGTTNQLCSSQACFNHAPRGIAALISQPILVGKSKWL